MRISVNCYMARYQTGKNTSDQVTIYMLEQSGRMDAALESLKSDAGFMKDRNARAGSADGVRWRATSSATGIGKSISR